MRSINVLAVFLRVCFEVIWFFVYQEGKERRCMSRHALRDMQLCDKCVLGAVSTVYDAGSKGREHKQNELATQVRGAAGQAAALVQGVRAPTLNAKGNWLTTMGSKVMKQRQRRVLVADGEELQLPEGVTASQTTGKLHFAVTFKFNEV
jgi:outer membrane murein-binding lipoprotein Lpp